MALLSFLPLLSHKDEFGTCHLTNGRLSANIYISINRIIQSFASLNLSILRLGLSVLRLSLSILRLGLNILRLNLSILRLSLSILRLSLSILLILRPLGLLALAPLPSL